ncbi:FitA-like ribbon-helix-helix domain-containing protein [Gloeobacter morelensis]|uniref:Antitoxin FitA-like ribbon-helix-helix domain-containing protein n=1 Tax=Gloeobacter morelensis MG652769 TaxID=2781736 RepID=A0ABY3PHN5_9CYAN|nr:hypothetical protein [Gloeobacter morelensis]UFP93139.1 hypothetical protein ISF26_15150 [Gloeobacter morelensis MG652769]
MVNISLRDIPDDVYEQIKQMAGRERRSINQQILVLLEQATRRHRRPAASVLEQIDRQREAIVARIGLLPDSTEDIAEDRER